MARTKKTLHLNRQNRKFLGVCAGVADYLEIEAWSVRLVFIISFFFGAWFLPILYFAAWFLLNEESGNIKDSISESQTFNHFKNVDYKKKIYRNKREGRLLGVCAGVADYLEVNVFVVRLMAFVLFFLSGTLMTVAYVGAYFILDERPDRLPYMGASSSDRATREKLDEQIHSRRSEIKQCARKFSNLQERLARLEAYVTSKQFRLHREFRNLS
ncbi:MAG: PspC domain-containing protein [Pseudomonadales bacterium]|nr:PspC domain-containing protein [Pseudomonadales bacterium]